MPNQPAHCDSCNAPVTFRAILTDDGPIVRPPLDPDPSPDGSVAVTGQTGRFLRAGEQPAPGEKTYAVHDCKPQPAPQPAGLFDIEGER